MKRREFLALTAAPLLAQGATFEEPRFRKPPLYVRSRPLIDAANDVFELEKQAMQIEQAASARLREQFSSSGKITGLRVIALGPGEVRYEVAALSNEGLAYRTGRAKGDFAKTSAPLEIEETSAARAANPWFRDVTGHLFGADDAFGRQLRFGVPYWRARLDPALGIDIYGNNGIAVGDADGDGFDEIYVCQPGGLPNRLYRRSESGAFTDVAAPAGVDVLDDTSCALFLDLCNTGRQDLVVLTTRGPLLFLNRSSEAGLRYEFKPEAFRPASPPRGTFTGMAAADYDRDGRLDLYLCTYIYFQGEDQYRYPSPYHDAQNGPANFLFQNRLAADGSGEFVDVTAEAGLDRNNNRYSFAPAWCDYDGSGWPSLYVANDFGRNNLYRNRGGKFEDVAGEAGVEDLGPGMSAAWFDYDGDGAPDLYVANMWSASGQRVLPDPRFAPVARDGLRREYARHAKGNSLYQNGPGGAFRETGAEQHAEFGRWAWSADAADFDNDGDLELYVTCGMLTGDKGPDLMSYFWRQTVAQSPAKAGPAEAYEHGWNNLNQWIREGYHWNGNEPNVFYDRKDGRFADCSGVSGLDFAGDSRAFAVTDFDGDGRLDVVVKNRLGPQIRAFQNACAEGGNSIAFSLRGARSNRDAIGARVEVRAAGRKLVRWLTAGSGYLSQHSKVIHIGLGEAAQADEVRVTWPGGTTESFAGLEAGYRYRIVEGEGKWTRTAFQSHQPLPETPVAGVNDPRAEEAWLVEPMALPVENSATGLFVVREPSPEMAVFRRYLFDYRAPLETPCAFLVDDANRVRKFYAAPPAAEAVRRDSAQMTADHRPFRGRSFGGGGRSQYRFAAAFLDAGYPDAALVYLREALRSAPDDPKTLLALGQIHLEKGELAQARTYLDRSLKLDPDSAEVHNNLGGVAMAERRYQDAARHFEQALARRPDAAYALANAGQAYARLGDTARAEQFLRKALTADPADADAANQMGLLLARQGRLDEARGLFQQAIEHRRDHTGAINNLGVLYMQSGQRNDAIAAFRYGLEVAPADENLCLNLARLYVAGGERDKAVILLEQHLSQRPGSERIRKALKELQP